MNIEQIKTALTNQFKVSDVSASEWKIDCGATFINGKKIEISLVSVGSRFILTDKKQTLKYMNDLYELNAKDVKSCISNVIKIYGFTISSGAIICEIKNESAVASKFFDMIMCIGQLANMYAFFDEPA